MQKPFPPGDICDRKIKSNWREFEFMFHQIQYAINPHISLKKTIGNWQEIRKSLAENNRRRKLQMSKLS
jgi:hypothetical protein